MKTLRLQAADPLHVFQAAAILRAGGLVAFPTETVYGLGADALNPAAVQKIFEAKQRPGWDPLIVHLADAGTLAQITLAADTTALTNAFWPGPLTLLLPRSRAIPNAVTAGRALVGVRMPRHPTTLDLIRLAGLPIAAPSANRFGHTSPTTAEHVLADLDGRIDAVLDGGATEVGLESTVLDPVNRIIYRPGAVTQAQIEAILGPVTLFQAPASNAEPGSLPSPGVGMRHYAPRARLWLVEIPHFRFSGLEDSLGGPLRLLQETQSGSAGVMVPDGWTLTADPLQYPWGPWDHPEVLARRLFGGLRALDAAGVDHILCPLPNGSGIAEAIRDRLRKAALPE